MFCRCFCYLVQLVLAAGGSLLSRAELQEGVFQRVAAAVDHQLTRGLLREQHPAAHQSYLQQSLVTLLITLQQVRAGCALRER